jgi:hypothetical protein
MQVILQLIGALAMPLGAFAFLFWMAHLEETLPADVKRAQRRPAPPPILAIPVRAAPSVTQPVTEPVVVPEQRPAPAVEATQVSGAGGAVTT